MNLIQYTPEVFIPVALYKAVGLAVARAAEEPSGVGFKIILNALSTDFEFAVALNVKFNVVEEVTFVGSDIAPVDEFKVKFWPDKTVPPVAQATVSPSTSVAETVAWVPVALSWIVASVPLAVLQAGDVSTLIWPERLPLKPEVL